MPDEDTPLRIGLLLLPGFALMGYAALIEALRGANALSGRQLYQWSHISPDGQAVAASSGARVVADHAVGDRLACDRLFVFAGGDPRGLGDAATCAWLRLLARHGTVLGGVSGGPYVLARAGLLAGRRATIHWEHRPALREAFPDIALESGLFVIDGPIITCAGGTAAMDLALALIAGDHTEELALRIGEWFVQAGARAGTGPQRGSLAERYGTTHAALLKALGWLESHIGDKAPRSAVAEAAGLSLRQLDRLCLAHLGASLAETAMAIRLEAAAHRLRTTDLALADIATDCGFASPAHFSRRFRARHGASPAQWRQQHRAPPPHPPK
ncbi:MAG TPA: GlxA family transcriptional regulator [Novosphingobium sp.]|nr:GlxA family transcriptional regulator [Novosphingobium sp.]